MRIKAAIGRVGVVSALAIIIVIAAVGVYATETSQMTTAKTTTGTTASTSSSSITTNMGFTTTALANSSYPTTLTTTNASIDLNFTLTLNSTLLIGGQAVNISASVTNDRSTFNNLTSASNWSEVWLQGWGMINSCNSFANAQIFQGYYTQSNISSLQSGTELQLAKPLFPPMECPFIPGAWSTYFPFQGHESQVGYEFSTKGDYGGANSSSSTFHLFDTGVYTIAAGDEWGQFVILHFLVTPSTETTTTSPFTTSTSASCSISGQPGGLMLRILSDSTLQSVVGANVSATNIPALCNNSPATIQSTTSIITSGEMWYSFPTENDASYSFKVSYSNQNYNFTANLQPASITCATLYVPSGKTNITILEFQSSCPSNSNNSTTTSGTSNCPNNYPNGIYPADAPTINLAENSTAALCVRFYYYNPNSTMQIVAGNVFGIAGYRQFNSTFSNGFDASSNFTIATSSANITLGGAQNLNEGILVEYSILANPNSNGTYNYGFQATYYPILETCNGFGPLVVGNGSPNYNVGFGSCTTPLTLPLNSEGFINGVLFVEVVGITNSSS